MRPHRVIETSLYVHDLEAAERFYHDMIGLEVFAREEGRHLFLRCGEAMLLLFIAEATRTSTEVSPHGCDGQGHVAFAMQPDEIDAWRARLLDHGVAIEQETDWPQGGYSIYFRDPAGNSIELVTPQLWGYER